MKNIINIFFLLIFIISSCKKKYTCNCSTLNSSGGNYIYINEETYQVKEKSKTDAQISCSKIYETSGKATNGVNCDVK